MMGTFEVLAYWKGKRTVRYFTVKLYNGIACDIYDNMVLRGYTRVDVRLMPC